MSHVEHTTSLPDTGYVRARQALLTLPLEFGFDLRASRLAYRPNDNRRWQPLGTPEFCELRQTVIDNFAFDPGKESLFDAAAHLAYRNGFDPFCDWLDSLKWDNKKRLARWPAMYLGADDSPFTCAVGARSLIAAVRRARKPGFKFDEILTLIGDQGCGKSRAARALAKRAEWFSDQDILSLSAQQQQEAIEGVVIYELSELGGLHRTSLERMKAFVSRQYDRGRRAYGRFREELPRRCIFIATTNERTFLRDPTGNRRFWPVEVGQCDIASLRRDVDQLWAEAAAEEASGARVTLPPHLAKDALAAQSARTQEDPWLALLQPLTGKRKGDEWRLGYAEVVAALNIATVSQTPEFRARVDRCLFSLGWRRAIKPFKLGGKTVRGYVRLVA